MKWNWFAVAAVLAGCLVASAQGALVTFEDVPIGTTVHEGESLISDGVTVSVPVQDGIASATVQAASGSVGSGHVLTGPGQIDFQVPTGTIAISFDLGEYNNLAVLFLDTGFGLFQGSSFSQPLVGGTLTAVATPVLGGTKYHVEITGPVTSMSVGGVEIEIDNVLFVVPEPAAGVLLCSMFIASCAPSPGEGMEEQVGR